MAVLDEPKRSELPVQPEGQAAITADALPHCACSRRQGAHVLKTAALLCAINPLRTRVSAQPAEARLRACVDAAI